MSTRPFICPPRFVGRGFSRDITQPNPRGRQPLKSLAISTQDVYWCDSTRSRRQIAGIGLCYARSTVKIAFYVLSILQIALGLYLLLQGLQWMYYTRRRNASDVGFYAPRTAVLCS